ncbi:MAG: hypothetical protein WAM14_08545 [Candidatus Nitrosopolaris sp.]
MGNGDIQILIKESYTRNTMQTVGRIPRWLIEKDPSWEKSGHSNYDTLEWTKRGAGLRAICDPASMFCDVIMEEREQRLDISDSISKFRDKNRLSTFASADIARYLSSRYLNPSFDINRAGLSKFRKF